MRWSIRSMLVAISVAAFLFLVPTRYVSLNLFAITVSTLLVAIAFYLRKRTWLTLALLSSAFFAFYTLSIGPVYAARLWCCAPICFKVLRHPKSMGA